MRSRSVIPIALGVLGALASGADARNDETEPAAKAPAPASNGAALPWMASFEASKNVPIGIDEADLRAWFDKKHKGEWRKSHKAWESLWNDFFLLQTPAHRQAELPAFSLSKYELTNAQWARFLEARKEAIDTKGDETLRGIVMQVWRISGDGRSEAEINRGVKTLIVANWAALQPTLDAKAGPEWDPKWDHQRARAAEAKLPKGLKLRYTRYMPPPHWSEDGTVPEHERKRPMRFVSWEQAMDFCQWAGFHLPTEFEWERAARGTAGRMFTWEGDWDPLKAVWKHYNAAAIAAKKPEFTPVTFPGTESDPPRETPGPMDVDLLPGGATQEGLQHMLGNVSELTISRVTKYPSTKCTTVFTDGSIIIARGGNYEDRAEILLASDRNMESHNDKLLPSHAVSAYGFRLAAYPVAGADLTLPLAERYNDARHMDSPAHWLPFPAGFTEKKDAELFKGLESQRTAGVLERQLANDDADHVFVTGPATGIAFLPVKGLALEHVKTVEHVKKLSEDADRPVMLGILTGTENATFEFVAPGGIKTRLSFADDQFRYRPSEREQTKETVGAVLLLEGDKVQVYRPTESVKSAAKYRRGFLGTLEHPVEFATYRGVMEPPTGRLEKDVAILTTTLPLLAPNGEPGKGSSAMGIRVTLKIPFRRVAPK